MLVNVKWAVPSLRKTLPRHIRQASAGHKPVRANRWHRIENTLRGVFASLSHSAGYRIDDWLLTELPWYSTLAYMLRHTADTLHSNIQHGMNAANTTCSVEQFRERRIVAWAANKDGVQLCKRQIALIAACLISSMVWMIGAQYSLLRWTLPWCD